MRNLFRVGLLAGALALCAAPAGAAAAKVSLCHMAADGRAHPITVADMAVTAHLAHGDLLGACPPACTSDGACDDANPCTTDACSADGRCAHLGTDCDDGNPCTADACDRLEGCLSTPIEGSCDDGNACTEGDACGGGACAGAPVLGCCTADLDCADAHTCTTDVCVDNVCVNQELTCSVDDLCLAAYCDPTSGSCAAAPVSCDDGDACTDDVCEPATGCAHPPTPSPPQALELSCDDGRDNDCDRSTDGSDADCQCQAELRSAVAASFIDVPERSTCLPRDLWVNDVGDVDITFCDRPCGDGLGCLVTMTWREVAIDGSGLSARVDVEVTLHVTVTVRGLNFPCTVTARADDLAFGVNLIGFVRDGAVVLETSHYNLESLDLTEPICLYGGHLEAMIESYRELELFLAVVAAIRSELDAAIAAATCNVP